MTLQPEQLAPASSETPQSASDPRLRTGPRGFPLLPGGLGRSTFAVGAPLPYALRGEGHRILDDRGRHLIDLHNNSTSLIHGHAEPHITEAATNAVRNGASFGLPNVYEWEHAERLLERFPSMDQVRYTNSGTEAVMTAVRVARAHTGRDRCIVVRDSYHGTSDVALSTDDRLTRGVPAGVVQDITRIAVNDAAALTEALARDADKYAAIVIDLMPGRAGLVQVEQSFVELARTLADRHGIVLIFDEVVTFRLRFHGLSEDYGVDPDMITLGKAIGGGFPIGAVLGIAGIMRALDPTSPDGLLHAGTFTANPVSMSAGAVALRLLTPEAIARLNQMGDLMRSVLTEELAAVNWEVRGSGSLLRPVAIGPAGNDRHTYHRLFWAAYDRGILLFQNGMVALSTPMDEEIVSDATARLIDAVVAVASGTDKA
jgi:glutamate-1-semialdehyde 2,1-aminomutase